MRMNSGMGVSEKLTTATLLFSTRGEYSPALYGILVIAVVMLARNGIAGIRLPSLGRPHVELGADAESLKRAGKTT